MGNVYRGSAVDIDGTRLWQVNNLRVDPRVERVLNGAANVDTVFAAQTQIAPIGSFETPALSAAHSLVPIESGAAIASAKFYFAKLLQGETVAGSGSHYEMDLNDCLAICRRIRAQQGQEASAEFEFIATYDGSNLPLSVSAAASLPTYSGTPEKYTLGPVYVGSTMIESQNVEFDTGIEVVAEGHSGQGYPSLAAIAARRPAVTVQTHDLSEITDAILAGAEAGGGLETVVFFRALSNAGGPVADATTSHMSLTFEMELETAGSVSGDEASAAQGELMIHPIFDGTNAIVTVATGVAIAAPAP